ncbi:MAG: hypothetical protein ABSF32_06015 [Ignavibacteria bacterium]
MVKKSLFIWIFLLIFGFSSMPEVGLSNTTKLAGKTEFAKKKPRKKTSRKKTSRKKSTKKRSSKKTSKKRSTKKSKKKYSSKKKKGSKNKRSAGKKKYSKRRKGSKRNRRHSRRISHRRVYTPPTNGNSVEYRNYQRSNENQTPEQKIENIAPPKEIKKEPKKEGE